MRHTKFVPRRHAPRLHARDAGVTNLTVFGDKLIVIIRVKGRTAACKCMRNAYKVGTFRDCTIRQISELIGLTGFNKWNTIAPAAEELVLCQGRKHAVELRQP
jgi:hypothetical protein